MRFIAPAILLATSLALAGCAGSGNISIPTLPAVKPIIDVLPPSWQPYVNDARDKAIQICGWAEPVENIAQIIGTLAGVGPAVGIATTVANSICNAVSAKGVRRGDARPRAVYGVKLKGGFVR